MTELCFVLNASCDSCEPLTLAQREVLERALAKMVLVGAEVGVSPDQMIKLLDSGMTVQELVGYVLTLAGYVV